MQYSDAFLKRINSVVPEDIARRYLGENTPADVVVAIGVFVVVFLLLLLLKRVVLQRVHALLDRVRGVKSLLSAFDRMGKSSFAVIALYLAARPLVLPETVDKVILGLMIIIVITQIIYLVQGIIEFMISAKLQKMTGRSREAEMPAFLKICIRFALWSLGILLVLSNLGVDITSLVAGLGIGGIAVALAAQSILSDLFSSFTLYFDKPFQIGDFVILGDHMGTVKNIGLKTTRIQALQGEELVIPNTELTNTRLRNFKKMEKRRIVFTIGVTYDTGVKKLKEIPEIIKECVNSQPNIDFDRSHFSAFGDFSLNFETVYHVNTGDYNEYMDVQQGIYLALAEAFEKEKIEFAFPTQTVHVVK